MRGLVVGRLFGVVWGFGLDTNYRDKMIGKTELLEMMRVSRVAVRVSDGRVFGGDGDVVVRMKRVAGRSGPERVISGIWCDDEDCARMGLQWEMFTGLSERVQFRVWCRKFLKDGPVDVKDGFYMVG